MIGAFGQQLVIGTDRWKGPVVWWEPGDNCRGVREPALGQTDNPLHFQFALSTVMTVGTGPTPEGNRGLPAGLYSDDVGADSPHSQCSGDSCLDVPGVHRSVEK